TRGSRSRVSHLTSIHGGLPTMAAGRKMSSVPWMLQLPKRPAQSLDFPFVGVLLPFGQLQRFKDFLHIVDHFPKGVDDAVDFFDRFLHSLGRSGTKLACQRRRRFALDW